MSPFQNRVSTVVAVIFIFYLQRTPLQDHAMDLPLLVNYFVGVYNKIYKKDILNVAPECISLFNAYEGFCI